MPTDTDISKVPPYTEDEVASFNAYQSSGVFHPFTCATDECRTDLEARDNGLWCPTCLYFQSWGHPWMFDWSWRAKGAS